MWHFLHSGPKRSVLYTMAITVSFPILEKQSDNQIFSQNDYDPSVNM